jgi:hypothetical protein
MRPTPDSFQDLSSAYGDQDDTLSWPMLVLVVVCALAVGWLVALIGLGWARLHWWWQRPASQQRIGETGHPMAPRARKSADS